MQSAGDPKVPAELKSIMTEFFISALVEEPEDFIDYAADYFARLRDTRNAADYFARLRDTRITPNPTAGENHIENSEAEEAAEEENIENSKADEKKSMDNFATKDVDLQNLLMIDSTLTECITNLYSKISKENILNEATNQPDLVSKTKDEYTTIQNLIKRHKVFNSLSDHRIRQIITAMVPRITKSGEIIITEGKVSDYFYLIERGKFEASVAFGKSNLKIVKIYDKGGYFGELALLHDFYRHATVRCTLNGKMWAMSKSSFRATTLHREMFRKRRRFFSFFREVQDLKGLSNYDTFLACDVVTPIVYSNGQVIAHKGDMCDGIAFVESGEINCIDNECDKTVNKKILRKDYFGGLELGSRHVRTLQAHGAVSVAHFDFESINDYLGDSIELLEATMMSDTQLAHVHATI